MAQGCLKCLKYTMCISNFLCFMCGVALMGLGGYLMATFKVEGLIPSLAELSMLSIPNLLLICGIIITCVSFLGFLGALKENRCLLLTFFLVLFLLMVVELALACLMLVKNEEIVNGVKGDLIAGLDSAKKKNSTQESEWDLVQKNFKCCGVNNYTDWGNNIPKSCCRDECDELPFQSYTMGCFVALSEWFEDNYLYCGIGVISICIVEVLGMCFAVTLFCHITSSGLGYKL